jgi:hypothetical protein
LPAVMEVLPTPPPGHVVAVPRWADLDDI